MDRNLDIIQIDRKIDRCIDKEKERKVTEYKNRQIDRNKQHMTRKNDVLNRQNKYDGIKIKILIERKTLKDSKR